MLRIITACAILMIAACGGERTAPPTMPGGGPSVPEPGSSLSSRGSSLTGDEFSVRSWVADSVGRLIRDARIEVMNGPHAGLATLTDSTGHYSFNVAFMPGTRLRAAKTGYRDQVRDLRNERDAWFRLESVNPSVNLTGNYSFTFTADATCSSIPPALRTRTYSTSISRGQWLVTLGGASFAPTGPAYPRTVDWNVVTVSMFEDYASVWFSDPPIVELVNADSHLIIDGHAEGTISESGAELPVVGTITSCPNTKPGNGDDYQCSVETASCRSTKHMLTITRE